MKAVNIGNGLRKPNWQSIPRTYPFNGIDQDASREIKPTGWQVHKRAFRLMTEMTINSNSSSVSKL